MAPVGTSSLGEPERLGVDPLFVDALTEGGACEGSVAAVECGVEAVELSAALGVVGLPLAADGLAPEWGPPLSSQPMTPPTTRAAARTAAASRARLIAGPGIAGRTRDGSAARGRRYPCRPRAAGQIGRSACATEPHGARPQVLVAGTPTRVAGVIDAAVSRVDADVVDVRAVVEEDQVAGPSRLAADVPHLAVLLP